MSQFEFIDLFSGIGGFHLALRSLGGKCVFSSEIDPHAIEVYQKNFKHLPHHDIKSIKSHQIPKHDVLCAGFPCQAFSVSGKRKGFKDSRGTLFFEIARIVKYHRPKVIFLENVKNFLKHDQGNTFSTIQRELNKLGYNIHYKVLSSSDFEVPQHRERIYILAFRKDLKSDHFNFPKPSKNFVTVENILQNKLPKTELENLIINRKDINIDSKKSRGKFNQRRPLQIGTINKGGQGERIYSIKAQGITLSAFGGGAAAKTGAFLIKGKIRRLHFEEAKLLQGFPKSFKLHQNQNVNYRLLGNAVSVPVIKKIFKEVLVQINFHK